MECSTINTIKMFKSPILLDINKEQHTEHDSFSSSSGSEVEAYHDMITVSNKRKNSSEMDSQIKRRKMSPHRSIPRGKACLSLDQKAKEGIFVVDPFHCRINIEFLRAFSRYHQTAPESFLNFQHTHIVPYFTSSSDEEEIPEVELKTLAPDMSYMGFTTGSSDEEHYSNPNSSYSYDENGKSNNARSNNSSSTARGSRKAACSNPKKKASSSASHSSTAASVNHSKIVNSSSLPRLADNSDRFTPNLTSQDIKRLTARVNSHYKSYPLNQRHGSTPMDISSCPGVQLLTEDEYIACSLLRIRPALYFHARFTLLHNFYHSVGYFRKSAAQKMLRIDVNKTGKLYDFLVKQNWLPTEEGGECRPEGDHIIIDDPETYHQL